MENKVSPEYLYDALTSHDILRSFDLIRTFKAEVKSGFVDVDLAQQYFDSLIIAYKEPKLSISSFSTICHLIKLVRIKKPVLLSSLHSILIPFLLQRLKESRTSLRSASMKAMVTIWEAAPREFENDLKTIGLKSRDPLIRRRLLEMIEEISKNSPGFTLESFLSSIVGCLVDANTYVVEAAFNLLVSYLNSLSPSKAKSMSTDLVGLLKINHVGHSLSIRLLSQLNEGRSVISLYKKQMFSSSLSGSTFRKQPLGSLRHTSTLSSSESSSITSRSNYKNSMFPPSKYSFDGFQNRDKILQLLVSFPEFLSIDKVQSLDITDDVQLLDIAEKIKPFFEGKETEKNWTLRIKSIHRLQSLLRGNAIVEYRQLLAKVVHDLSGCIAKASQSLRTILSSSGCQLCKELAFALGPKLDSSTIDAFVTPLLKLSCSRKTITHRKANLAMISLVLFTNSSNRMMTQIYSSFLEKNVQARAYALIWAEFFLLRHAPNSSVMDSSLNYLSSIIGKAVSDPSPMVRQIARPAFWTLNEFFPKDGRMILSSLSHSTLKALDKSRYAAVNMIPSALSGCDTSHSRESSDSRSSGKLASFSDPESSSSPLNPEFDTSERKPLVTTILAVSALTKNDEPSEVHNDNSLIKNENCTKNLIKQSQNLKGTPETAEVMKPQTIGKAPQLGEYSERVKRENEIYNGLLSQDSADQKAAFDELIKMRNSHLPAKFGSAFNELSVRNPEIMYAVFSDEKGFQYLVNYLSTNNIVRIFCFYVMNEKFTVNASVLSMIIRDVPIDDLCLGLTEMISACNDSSKIQDLALSFQLVKHRDELLRASFELADFLLCSNNVHLESYLLSSLFDSLFQSWEFSDHSEDGKYITLLKDGAKKNITLFRKRISCLKDVQLQSEIIHKLALKDESDLESSDVNLDYLPTNEELEDAEEPNLDGLTMVVRKDVSDKSVPVDSDMTMIMPTFKNQNPAELSLIKEENTKQNTAVNNENNPINPFVDESETNSDDSKQMESSEMKIDDVFNSPGAESTSEDINSSISELNGESMDLEEAEPSVRTPTTGMKRLSINDSKEEDHNLPSKDTPLQDTDTSISHKSDKHSAPSAPSASPASPVLKDQVSVPASMDPLAPLTKPTDNIQIYEDKADFSDSLKGALDSKAWQDLETYELHHVRQGEVKNESDLLTKLKAKTITYEELIAVMYQLDQSQSNPDTLINYLLDFLSPETPMKQMLVAIYLIGKCLPKINKEKDEPITLRLLELCVLLDSDVFDELYFALEETMKNIDDLKCLVMLLQKKGFRRLTVAQKQISLHAISTWLRPSNITYEDVFMLDSWLFKLLDDEHVILRKLAVTIYAKLYKFMVDHVKSKEGDELIDKSIFQKMDGPQIELIKYYAAKV